MHGHASRRDSRNFAEIKKLISQQQAFAVGEAEVDRGLPAHRRRRREKFTACRRSRSTSTKSARWIRSWTSSARASRWKCSANRACWPSPVVEGIGWVDCAHGRFPVPAPATLAILGARGIGVTQCDEPHELVTPTGAALLAEFAESFGPMRGLVAEKIGFGLGTRENQTRPNVLRAVLGKGQSPASSRSPKPKCVADASDVIGKRTRIAVLETNLDDINAEILGHFVEQALAAGALDVFHTPIQMKKNRPGVLLTVLCAEARRGQVQRADFARDQRVWRAALHRRAAQIAARVHLRQNTVRRRDGETRQTRRNNCAGRAGIRVVPQSGRTREGSIETGLRGGDWCR